MRRYVAAIYGGIAYTVAMGAILYLVGFVINIGVPKGIDDGVSGPVVGAVVVNTALMGLFGIQHSLMARSRFKTYWERIVPKPFQRSTYVLCTGITLAALFRWWRPLPTEVWMLGEPVAWVLLVLYGLGLTIAVISIFLISHNELFGLQQIYAYLQGREPEPIPFQTPGFYEYVRHPMMTGVLIMLWVTPRMTVGHLLFSIGISAYIFVGVYLEEREMVETLGDRYERYQQNVPMFVPRPGRTARPPSDEARSVSESD